MKSLLKLTGIALGISIAFTSCKKDNSVDNTEFETTFTLSSYEGISENLMQDANDVLNEVAADNNLQGTNFTSGAAETNGILNCATVTITPANSFPKTIVIDFGAGGCTSPNGIVRSGKINVTLTDSLRRPGSVATLNFDNYFVSGFKKEGNVTWTNTSTANTKSWRRTCTNGKITAPNGNYWLHSGTQNVTQIAGNNTPLNLIDDVFTITGNRTITNAAGNTRVGTIINALQKKASCENIDQGTYQIQGPNHTATIDYGNGACDKIATISIDGRPARTFLLR
ncbi:hypothetical protein ACFOWM_11355 [Ferruginibacter yonginensis]|uniref:Lipoprotein n=1 Tax=Ferruginibacter yonginensis TaxID=1310416 RepID=A0ABV8QT61_9BACT